VAAADEDKAIGPRRTLTTKNVGVEAEEEVVVNLALNVFRRASRRIKNFLKNGSKTKIKWMLTLDD